MTMRRHVTLVGLVLALVALYAAWLYLPGWAVNMIALALADALVVLGLLILMRAGLVSFGQGLYYGIGAYAAALAGMLWGVRDVFVLMALGTVSAGAVAFALGFLLRRYRDIFFAMLSLAFSMILFGILVNSASLGSTDGFGVGAPTFLGWEPSGASRLTELLYAIICLVSFAAAYGAHRYIESAMGHIGDAIRENEVRVEYLGVSVRRAIHVKYVFAASLAGMGGVLTALVIGHVTPEDFTYWTKSGEFVFVAILSGTGHVAAPFIGSMVFELVRTYALEYAPNMWQMLLGATLLLVILFLPGGLWSLLARLRGRA